MATRKKLDSDVLTLKEVARYLRLHEMTVYGLVRKGKVPMRKVGGQWRIHKDVLAKYIKYIEGGDVK